MKKNALFTTLSIIVFATSCSQEPKLNYPKPTRSDVTDNYHGTLVADPYRWLENSDHPETQSWIASQNEITRMYLDGNLEREKIKNRLTSIWNYPKYGTPFKHGDMYFFYKNDGLQNQSVLYKLKDLSAEPTILIDPNSLSTDGTVALTLTSFSTDGKMMAYATSASGSDLQIIKIKNVETLADLPEVIQWCKFTSIAWKHDGSGFFYNRLPEPGTVAKEDENKFWKVYFHKINTQQSADELVYEDSANKNLGFSPFVSEDGKYVFLYVWNGTDPRNRIYYREVDSKKPFIKLFDQGDATYNIVFSEGQTVYVQTTKDAPKGKIISIDLKKPEMKNWKTIIPESDHVLNGIDVGNRQFILTYMKNASHQLLVHNLDGKFQFEMQLPTLGTVSGLSSRSKDSEIFYGFTSFLYPTTIFRYDLKTKELKEHFPSALDMDVSKFETKQVFYSSKDGTQIPMFVTHKKGLELNGNQPVFLYGYGGFNVNMLPNFSLARMVWLEAGGVYAMANLRGGGEYGDAWHEAGKFEKKQNVFDDFHAAAEWFVANKYSTPKKIAINGGSNGGLLVAAAMTQRPELYGAVVCAVPVIDMLRYHRFTVGHYWTVEWGNADSASQFPYLYKYSPLHNIRSDKNYPPLLITTAESDDRVVPAHAFKFAAELQHTYQGNNPMLIRIETKAGHGAGKPTSKVIDEQADIYSFIFKQFGMKL